MINLSRFAGLLAIIILLAACATPVKKPGVAFDRISEDLANSTIEHKTSGESLALAMMPPLQIELPKAATEVEPRFDLSVVDAPAAQVFMALVSGTQFSMLLPPELSGKISVNLKNVTLREALDTLRDLNGYEYKVQGTRIFVQPNSLQSRVFQINYLSSRRQGNSDLRVTSSSISAAPAGQTPLAPVGAAPQPAPTGNGSGTRSSDTGRVSMSSDADFWRDLTTALNAIVGASDGRQVIVNPMSGVLVVRAFPADLRNVESYLKTTQLIVDRQVMLEAKIIEVTLSNNAQSGVNWSALKIGPNSKAQFGSVAPAMTINQTLAGSALSATNGGLPGVGGPAITQAISSALGQGFMGLAFQTSNFAALISFLESQGDVAVLSSPRIATLNNQKALLKVGTDELFITNVSTTTTSSSTGGSVSTPSLTLQPYFSGISLDVTPQIDDEGNIILHVHPAVSTVAEKIKVIDLGVTLGTFQLPLASSTINETDSIVRVQDGNIVAIGGLMRQRQEQGRTQVPGIGNTPMMGNLFGQDSSTSLKSELVILIKPTIINSDKVSRDDLLQVQSRIQALDPRQQQKTSR